MIQVTSWDNIIFMIVIHTLAVVALLPQFWSWVGFFSFLTLYWVTACLGVTLGYHRLLSHRSFKVPMWLERFFATCGALSCQFGPLDWVGIHRQHHRFADTDRDPHNSRRGFWWSHAGWMMEAIPARANVSQYTKDLQDPYYIWLNSWFLLFQIPLGLLLFLLGGWSAVLWGIFLRLVVTYQCTWLVNSATHFWGKELYGWTDDESLNNRWVSLVTFGEGWHANHHSVPHSAKHGWTIEQLDPTWQHIRLLYALGLATNVKLPKSNTA